MAGKGRPKNSTEIAGKVRFIVDGAIKKLGIQKCIEMLADEIEQDGFAATLPKLASYFPKEVQADITTTVNIEDFVTNMVSSQINDSTEEANEIGRAHV